MQLTVNFVSGILIILIKELNPVNTLIWELTESTALITNIHFCSLFFQAKESEQKKISADRPRAN